MSTTELIRRADAAAKPSEAPAVRPLGLTSRQRLMKRILDIVLSSLALLLVLPVFIIIATLIKLESRGPILFQQKRVGQGGRLFYIYKFRSMVSNAERMQSIVTRKTLDGKTLQKHENDPRITRIGRFLRKTSIDEVPQLINVLKGDMSLVGPRPELPWLVEEYEPWQNGRFLVPQGLTGWWQVTGRSEKPCHLSTEDDMYYVEHYSFWLDIRIMLMTIPALMRGKGAF
jgi:exopolysaccharide biosynthesis polyprenyl glycosylphosphotransferase